MAPAKTKEVETVPVEAAPAVEVNKGKVVNVGKFTIKRNPSGLLIDIISDKIEDFFKGLSGGKIGGGTTTKEGWKDHSPYTTAGIPEEALLLTTPDGKQADLRHYGEPLKIGANHYNLAFLRCKGLSEGIKMQLPGVYSDEELKKLEAVLRHVMLKIYVNYMKPFNVSCELVSTERQLVESAN